MLGTVLFLWLLASANTIAAAPNIVFPINSQVPPVARVLKAFQFVFAESTFTSSAKIINYALSGSPSWLSLDSTSRKMSGTAPPEAAGPVLLKLIASDETGSTSMDVTLIVSADPGPGLGVSVSDQLAAQGAFSAPDSFRIARSGSVYLSFQKSTFMNTNEKTVYYAICADNTPLPSWLKFDPSTLSLTGTAPQSTSPSELPQLYGIQLIASDVIGFSGAVAKFQIILGTHVLSFEKNRNNLNVIGGIPVDFSELGAALSLDGISIKPSEFGQVEAHLPDWMYLDKTTLKISGIPPPSVASQDFLVTVTDIYGDTASTTLSMQVSNTSGDLFRWSIGILNATSGSDFDYTIDQSILTSPDIAVALNPGEDASWLNFNMSTLRLYGHVPDQIQTKTLHLNITVTSGSYSESQIITIEIEKQHDGIGGQAATPSKSTSASASPDSVKSSERSPAASFEASKPRRRWLPAVIILPVASSLAGLLLMCMYMKRKRQRESVDESLKPEKDEISRPIEPEASWLTIREDETAGQSGPNQHRESSKPPKLEFKDLWSSSPIRQGSRSRWSRMAGEESNPSQNAELFQEYVRRNFNAVRPEPDAVQAFNRQVEEYSLSRPQTRRRSARSRCSAASKHSSVTDIIIPSYGYPKAGKTNLRMSLLSARLLSGQHVSGLGRADISMGHGVDTMERGAVHCRADSDMALYARLSQAGFGNIGNPHEFGLVQTAWRNVGARSYDTSEYTTTDSSSPRHNGRPSEVSLLVRAFPQTPTSNTLQMCSSMPTKGAPDRGKRPQTATIRMVAPSPASSVRGEPSLQKFHRQRISSQRLNPFLSAGPTSRACSVALLKASRKSAGLSRNQSINSVTLESRGHSNSSPQRHRSRREEKPNCSPSRSSILLSSQSPDRRHQPAHRRHRLSAFGNFLHTRHRSSISMTSSQRYASPDYSEQEGDEGEERDEREGGVHIESFYGTGQDDIEEDIDEDGHRLWRPVETVHPGAATYECDISMNPYRSPDIFTPPWSDDHSHHHHDDRVGENTMESDMRQWYIDNDKENDNSNHDKHDNDNDNGNDDDNNEKSPNRPVLIKTPKLDSSRKRLLVVGGARGKRPVSMDVQGGLGKGWSMRGDMRGGDAHAGGSTDASAFL